MILKITVLMEILRETLIQEGDLPVELKFFREDEASMSNTPCSVLVSSDKNNQKTLYLIHAETQEVTDTIVNLSREYSDENTKVAGERFKGDN